MSGTDREIHASDPHCGVCVYVTFRDDWDRTPYCTYRERVVEVPGDVCPEFERL